METMNKSRLKRRLAAACLAFVATVGAFTGPARAADDVTPHDGRLDIYVTKTVALDTGTAGTWLIFMMLGVVGLTGMFKDAKRSHLD
jgi:hypothetical protein